MNIKKHTYRQTYKHILRQIYRLTDRLLDSHTDKQTEIKQIDEITNRQRLKKQERKKNKYEFARRAREPRSAVFSKLRIKECRAAQIEGN